LALAGSVQPAHGQGYAVTLSRLPTRCKHCKAKFTAEERSRGFVLHEGCVEGWVKANLPKLEKKRVQLARRRAAEGKRAIRARKQALKTPTELEQDCRRIVQKIARIRDRDDGCISCEKGPNWQGQWHGSHFRSVGACSALSLHLWNIHKACSVCNHHKSGNIAEYAPRLVRKIGQERVDWLNSQNQTVRRSREYLERFKKVMGKRLRRMEKKLA
jgi:hypothetical protein